MMYRIAAFCLIAALSACASLNGDLPAVTADGLTRVDKSRFDTLYVRSGINFADYDSIYAEPLVVEFDERWVRQQKSSGTYKLPQEDRERIIANLNKEFNAVFVADIAAENDYAIVTEPDERTLILRASVTQLRIYSPDAFVPYRQTVLVEETGSALLGLDMVANSAGEAVLRMSDRTRGQNYGNTLRTQTRVQNRQDTILLLRRWAVRMNEIMAANTI